jgi:hypothetical protein
MPAKAPIAAETGVDADKPRGQLVSGGRDQRLANQGAVGECPEQQDDDCGTCENEQALRQDGCASHTNRIVSKQGGQAVKSLIEDELRRATQEDRSTDSDDDQHHGTCAAGGLDCATVQCQADHQSRNDGEQRGHRNGQPGERQKNSRHSAQHHELALGEIDDVAGVVDQGKAESDQGIDCAHRQSGKEELQSLGHRLARLAMPEFKPSASLQRVSISLTYTGAARPVPVCFARISSE